jgi:hypothetical protein
MATATITSREIVNSLCAHHWEPTTHLLVPNACSLCGWEQDLVVIHKSGFMEEVEVKISASDYRREFSDRSFDKFRKHSIFRGELEPGHGSSRVRRFWFAMPAELAEKLAGEIPEYAGLLSVKRAAVRSQCVTIVKKAPILRGSRKLEPEEQIAVLRLAHLRYWDVRRKEKWSDSD